MSSLLKLTRSALMLAGLGVVASVNATEHKAYVQFNAGAAFAPSDSIDGSGTACIISGATTGHCVHFNSNFIEDYDPGFAGSVAIGYQIADQFRLEGEALYQSNDNDKVHFSYSGFLSGHNGSVPLKGERERTAFLLNGYYDFKNSTAFTPYITAGLGGYHLRLKGEHSSVENDLDFAWQAGAGVNYKLDDRISFDLKYRYFGGTDAELQIPSPSGVFTSSRLYEVGDHQVMAGIRIGF
ncbi:MAG: porin family protein [Methyloglobulus sp.]|nr:porin family protein [Methyloglobulus sp.]